MVELTLPPMKFSLPEWRPNDLVFMQEKASHLHVTADNAGQVSDGMKRRAAEILAAVEKGTPLSEQIHSGKDIRAVLMLWLHYNQDGTLFDGRVPLTPALLSRFREIRPVLSKLALHDLAQVYFDHYDRIRDLELFCDFLRFQFGVQSFAGQDSRLALLAQNRTIVFGPEAPAQIVQEVTSRCLTLGDVATRLGIPETEGVFREKCTLLYYISNLKDLHPGEESDLFAEILQDKVVKTPYKDGLLIGHVVLNILIETVLRFGVPMPENWMKIILSIAGDPRVPTRSRSFQIWWRRLDQSYIDQVRGWLSRFDLDLFLRAFEAFANQSDDQDLRRMFPARKRFLEGLYEHGLIGNTRLFVGRHASHFLKDNYDAKELPVYAELNHKDKSIIYMNIAGLHVIEGSHSAKFWIFDRLPETSKILDYNVRRFDQSALGGDLEHEYRRLYPTYTYDLPVSVIHHPNVSWQRKAIKALEGLGVRLNVEKLLTPQDYHTYKQKYGLSYHL